MPKPDIDFPQFAAGLRLPHGFWFLCSNPGMGRNVLPEIRLYGASRRGPGEPLNVLRPAALDPGAEHGVLGDSNQVAEQAVPVAGRAQQRRVAIARIVAEAADIGADEGAPARHGFGRRQGPSLRETGAKINGVPVIQVAHQRGLIGIGNIPYPFRDFRSARHCPEHGHGNVGKPFMVTAQHGKGIRDALEFLVVIEA